MYGSGLNFYPAYKSTGLLAKLGYLKSKINFGAILTNAQKTLNVVNQAIPLVYQVKPIINNAKTVFKVISAVKKDDKPHNNYPEKKEIDKSSKSNSFNNSNEPIFFI